MELTHMLQHAIRNALFTAKQLAHQQTARQVLQLGKLTNDHVAGP